MGTAFIGTGRIFLAQYSDSAVFESRKFSFLENSSAFEISNSDDPKSLMSYTSAAGGIDAKVDRIKEASGKIDLRHLSAANLATALWGATNTLNTTPITGESGYKIVPNMFLPTKRLINTSVAPVVKKGATTILTADYTVSAGGILISSTITTGSVSSGDAITIDYTPQASADVQSLLSAAPDVSIIFEGINAVDGKYNIVKIWKAKLGAAQNLSLIGDDFATLSLPFAIQLDASIVTAGKSQFYQIEQAS